MYHTKEAFVNILFTWHITYLKPVGLDKQQLCWSFWLSKGFLYMFYKMIAYLADDFKFEALEQTFRNMIL